MTFMTSTMGEIAEMMLEQEMLDGLVFGNERYEDEYQYRDLYSFPSPASRRKISHRELVKLAKQAAHDGNIVEQAMRCLTLEQVIARSKRLDND